MTKFNELSIADLRNIVKRIDMVFDSYRIDTNSKDTFWECVDIGNKKYEAI